MIPRGQPILLVEDSPEDRTTTIRALVRAGLANPIFECEDGDSALDFLHRRGRYTDPASAPRPGIILLDLNMPGTDGREVLAEIKSDDHLKRIPVVILTTSRAEEDVLKTYDLHANCYISKPIDLHQFMRVVKSIEDLWLSIVVLPPDGAK